MEITQAKKDNVVILELKGRLDTNTSVSLEEKLLDLIDKKHKKILIDFFQLDFISSSGLAVLMMAGKKLKSAKGKMVFCALKDHIKQVFDIAGFTILFSLFPSQEEAMKDLK